MTLHDRFADVLMEQWPSTIWRRDAALVTADAFLAMPEMQAIKDFLRCELWLREQVRSAVNDTIGEHHSSSSNDPIIFIGMDGTDRQIDGHVIDWVLS